MQCQSLSPVFLMTLPLFSLLKNVPLSKFPTSVTPCVSVALLPCLGVNSIQKELYQARKLSMSCYLTHSWDLSTGKKNWIHKFAKGMCAKLTQRTRLDFDLENTNSTFYADNRNATHSIHPWSQAELEDTFHRSKDSRKKWSAPCTALVSTRLLVISLIFTRVGSGRKWSAIGEGAT